MRALELSQGELQFQREYPEAAVPEGSTRVQVTQAGICETDLQLLAGYMGFSGVLGHEFVGVAQTGPFAGKRVVGEINCTCNACSMCERGLGNHCPHRTVIGILNHDGAFADSLIVPESNLHLVPDALTDDLATLVEPVAAALQIGDQIDLAQHPQVLVIGDGRLGFLCSQVVRIAGCNVHVVGKHAEKLERFSKTDMPTTLLTNLAPGGNYDLVVDCTGSSSGLAVALDQTRPRGTVVLKTTIANDHQIGLAPIVIDELTVVGSRCGPFDKAIDLLQTGQLPLDDFITERFSIDDFRSAFDRAKQPDALKVILEIS